MIHSLEQRTEWRPELPVEGEYRSYYVWAECSCGWRGEEHDAQRAAQTSLAHGQAKADYREHAEEALGAEAYYEAPAGCLNCSWEGDVSVLIGTDVWGAHCPRCSTKGRLRPQGIYQRDRDESPRGRWPF